MINQNKRSTSGYPWKSFLLLMGLYLLSLAAYFPALLTQAEIYIEILGESFTASPVSFAITALIWPLLFGFVAIYFGTRYAHKVNLRSIMTERIEDSDLTTDRQTYTLKDSIPLVLLVAGVVALIELGFDVVFQNWLSEFFQPNFTIPSIEQALSGIFYNGLGQELLLRWGVMTSIVYVLSSKGERLNTGHYVVGIIFTALLYAFAQYSSVIDVVGFNFMLLLWILLVNGLAGILYGWLYMKFHFEAAALSHMLANTLIILGNILIVGMIG